MAPRKSRSSEKQASLFDSVPQETQEKPRPVSAPTNAITSDQIIKDWDAPFRVLAGPGAGKTFWLANHIAHVVRHSSRLHALARVACISYTNVATGRIQTALEAQLGPSAARVEVSTIHSFLYKVFVAPYVGLVCDPTTNQPFVPPHLVDGHDEHHPAHNKIEAWLNEVMPGRGMALFLKEQSEWREALKKTSWKLYDGQLVLRSLQRPPPQYLPLTKLMQYKKLYWQDGILDHADVLYFAYRISSENPALLPFIVAAYPYVFLDEFQDTNPLQTAIVKALAENGAVVGVVGDRRQAIYHFQGARPEDFDEFQVEGQVDYTIPGNRRSTRAIIRVLNAVRGGDLIQEANREVEGEPVRILIGTVPECMEHALGTLPPRGELVILTRSNEDVVSTRVASGTHQTELWSLLEEKHRDRCRLLRGVTEAFIHSSRGAHGLAANALQRHVRLKDRCLREPFTYKGALSDLERRGLVVLMLSTLLREGDNLRSRSVREVYQLLSDAIATTFEGAGLTKARTGAFADFATATVFGTLVDTFVMLEDNRPVRTIHKSKGDEFDNVLVLLDEDEVKNTFFAATSSKHGEESNIRYVALSRARERLFIGVTELSAAEDAKFEKIGLPLEISRLSEVQA